MPLFQEKAGLNPLDSPTRRNIDSIQASNHSITMRHQASFQMGDAYSIQRTDTMNSHHQSTKSILKKGRYSAGNNTPTRSVINTQKINSLKSQKKKKSWFKRIFKRKDKVPLWKKNLDKQRKEQQRDQIRYPESDDDFTVLSPASILQNSPDKKYFTNPTEGFECILDVNSLSRKLSYQSPEKPSVNSQLPQSSDKNASSVSPFDTWESFVTLLTSTNESMKLSLYDASETLKKYFVSEESIHASADDDKSKKKSDNNIANKGKPMNEVTLHFSEKLPFGDIASQSTEKSKDDNASETDQSKRTRKVVSKSDKGDVSGIAFNEVSKDKVEVSSIASSAVSKAETITKEVKSKAYQMEEKGEESDVQYGAPVIMPYDVPSSDGPTEEVYDSLFTLSFLRVSQSTKEFIVFILVQSYLSNSKHFVHTLMLES